MTLQNAKNLVPQLSLCRSSTLLLRFTVWETVSANVYLQDPIQNLQIQNRLQIFLEQ